MCVVHHEEKMQASVTTVSVEHLEADSYIVRFKQRPSVQHSIRDTTRCIGNNGKYLRSNMDASSDIKVRFSGKCHSLYLPDGALNSRHTTGWCFWTGTIDWM